eukprot:scaffold3867_cov180-Amphora_coffeaeformis.AAC.2
MGSSIYSHFDNPVQDYSPNEKSRQTKFTHFHIAYVTTLSSHESILAKDAFEQEASGFSVEKYCTDNGIFTSKHYRQALAKGQSATRSAVGAHHQNGVAEANSFAEPKLVVALCNVCKSLDVLPIYSFLAYRMPQQLGEPLQAIESPTLTQQTSQPQSQQHSYHNQDNGNQHVANDSFHDYLNPQEVVPVTLRPSDSSCVLPDDQLFNNFKAQPQQASQGSSQQSQLSCTGSCVIEVKVRVKLEEHTPEGVPQSPFCPQRST